MSSGGPAEKLHSASRFFYAGQIGPVPVWVEVGFTVEAGYSVTASAQGSISRQAELSVGRLWEATFDARRTTNLWQFAEEAVPTEVSYSPLNWQIEGDLSASLYYEPAIQVEINSLVGIKGALTSSLNLDGSFQANHPEYEWKLYRKPDASISPTLTLWNTNWGFLPGWNIPVVSNYIAGAKHPNGLTILGFEGLTETNQQGVLTGEISEAETFSIKVIDTSVSLDAVQYQWYRGGVLLPIAGAVFSATGDPNLLGSYRVVATMGTNSDSKVFELTLRPDQTPPVVNDRLLPDGFVYGRVFDGPQYGSWGTSNDEGSVLLNSRFQVEAADPESGVKDYSLVGIPRKLVTSLGWQTLDPMITNSLAANGVYWTATATHSLTGHIDDSGAMRPGAPDNLAHGEQFYLLSYARNHRGLISESYGYIFRIVRPLRPVYRDHTYFDSTFDRNITATNGIVTIPGVCVMEFTENDISGRIVESDIEGPYRLFFIDRPGFFNVYGHAAYFTESGDTEIPSNSPPFTAPYLQWAVEGDQIERIIVTQDGKFWLRAILRIDFVGE